MIGQFKNGGRQWRPAGTPAKVDVHDFPNKELGKAIPYGIYDVAANTGWVNVGCDHDTAAFAVESIRRWWQAVGRSEYPHASRLLITADAGGSNGYRTRAWKVELTQFAAETGLEVTVCHLPPGTSKWNKVEHRLFSHITMNWCGRPLTSHEVIVQSIAATTTRTGLTVDARLDTGSYPTGVEVSDPQLAALPITRHVFHGDWNYTLHPTAEAAAATPETAPPAPDEWHRAPTLPELTGMTATDLDELITLLADLRQAQREERSRNHPANDTRHKPRTGRPPTFQFPDRVVATLLHLRLGLSDDTIARLPQTSPSTIYRVVKETRHLIKQLGRTVQPIPAPTHLPTHIPRYIPAVASNNQNKIKKAC